jgi:hypothetical protein
MLQQPARSLVVTGNSVGAATLHAGLGQYLVVVLYWGPMQVLRECHLQVHNSSWRQPFDGWGVTACFGCCSLARGCSQLRLLHCEFTIGWWQALLTWFG